MTVMFEAIVNTIILYILSLCAAINLSTYIGKRRDNKVREWFITSGIIFPILVALNFIIHI